MIWLISEKDNTAGSFLSDILVERISAGSFSIYSCEERYLKNPLRAERYRAEVEELIPILRNDSKYSDIILDLTSF